MVYSEKAGQVVQGTILLLPQYPRWYLVYYHEGKGIVGKLLPIMSG